MSEAELPHPCIPDVLPPWKFLSGVNILEGDLIEVLRRFANHMIFDVVRQEPHLIVEPAFRQRKPNRNGMDNGELLRVL